MIHTDYTDTRYQSLQLGIWDMFTFAWHLIEENIIPLALITLIVAIPTNILANILLMSDILPVQSDLGGFQDTAGIYQLIGFFFSMIGYVAGLFVIRNFLMGVKTEVSDALIFGLKKWWIFIGTAILAGLAMLGGFLLFIIPGIIVTVWFMFSSYAVIFEDKRFVGALNYSRTLVQGRWWQSLGFSCGFGLVAFILISIPTLAVIYMIESQLGGSADIISAVLRDTLISLVSIPSTYIAVGLFLAFQKFPKQTETPV